MYFVKFGFLDGWKGFRIAQISAASNILKYKELRRLSRAAAIKTKTIVISRTDSIGDVVLTLPLTGILKKDFPNAKVIFLGTSYTEPVVRCSQMVDEIWKWDEISKMPEAEAIAWLKEKQVDVFIHVFPRKEIAKWAKAAGIPHRIGTSHRLFHLLTCNHRVNFTRKRSDLHESQLNTKLLAPLGITRDFELETLGLFPVFQTLPYPPERFANLFAHQKAGSYDPFRKVVIFHPKSKGSAVEWDIDNYMKLASELDETKFTIIFTGTENEGAAFRHLIPKKPNIIDLTGQLTLKELIGVIRKSDALVAASTGPLHVAGLCNITAIGLFASKKPIHAGRWKPLGIRSIVVEDKNPFVPNQPLGIDYRDIKGLLDVLK